MFRSLFNSYSIDRKEHSIGRKSIESNFRPIENYETRFFVEFSGDYSERLKSFQTLLAVLWNILTLHTCLLMKHNPMSINRGLRSLEIMWLFSKTAICRTQHLGCILETNLQWTFSNNSVGSKYCLRKTILCLLVIYFLFVFCVNIILPLLFCIISPALI